MDYEDFIEFIDIVDEEEVIRIPKRYIRDMENPFDYFYESQFKKRYRFSKATIREVILPLIIEQLVKVNNRGLPIPPLLQLLISLRFYATGNFQIVSGDLRGVSQSSVSRIIKRVSQLLAAHLRNFIKFPDHPQELMSNTRKFFELGNFPAVSACVDGVHVAIKNPGGDGEIFRNRKGVFSINVQGACGPSMELLDIVVRFPGSMHDNVMFERSSLRIQFENNNIQGKLLGDNGYSCKRYLLTPVINPVDRAERRYNIAHKRTRNIVERTFGIWKKRFPCLKRVLNTSLETSVEIICATAVLHNIGRMTQDEFEDEEDDDPELIEDIVIDNPNAAALRYRRASIYTHFAD